MSIRHSLEEIKNTVSYDKDGEVEPTFWRVSIFRKLLLSIVIILIATLSFGLGRLSEVGKREPVKIEYNEPGSVLGATKQASPNVLTEVVASKNGAKYHYPHCSGAKRIKEENKIVFKTPAEAESAGYTIAVNCSPR